MVAVGQRLIAKEDTKQQQRYIKGCLSEGPGEACLQAPFLCKGHTDALPLGQSSDLGLGSQSQWICSGILAIWFLYPMGHTGTFLLCSQPHRESLLWVWPRPGPSFGLLLPVTNSEELYTQPPPLGPVEHSSAIGTCVSSLEQLAIQARVLFPQAGDAQVMVAIYQICVGWGI